MNNSTSMLDLDGYDLNIVDAWLCTAKNIQDGHVDVSDMMRGKILCPVFLQESSRTFMNSTAGFLRMGGQILPLHMINTRFGSKWAEPVQDFCTLIDSCCDFTIFRSPDVDALFKFNSRCKIPLINAGNGSGIGSEHPIQALVDLYTIKQIFRNASLDILMVGGKHIRSTRTQIKLFHRYGHRLTILSPQSPVCNTDIDVFCHKNCIGLDDIRETDLSKYQIIYHNGIDEDPEVLSTEKFLLTRELLMDHKFKGKIMHSLPRKNELSDCIDNTEFNLYFAQMRNSIHVFQAVFSALKTRASMM